MCDPTPMTESELRWLADQLALRDLIARVAQLADTGEVDEYAACWAEDGEWVAPTDSLGVSAGDPPRRGRDSVIAGVRHRRAMGVQGPGTHTRHVVSTTSLTRTGPDSATGRSYWRYYADTDALPRIVLTGQYDDEFVRSPDGWRLRVRRVSRT